MGTVFFQSCTSIFNEIDSLKSSVETRRTDCVGDLWLGASDNICNYVLPEILGRYSELHPRVRIKLFSGTSDAIKADLLSARSELGLFYTRTDEPEFEVEKVAAAEFVIVSAKKLTLAQLPETHYIASRISDYSRKYPALWLLQSLGIKPKLFLETNNQETQKRMTMRGYGYTVVPRHMVAEELKRGELRLVKAPKRLSSDIYLVKRKHKSLSKPAAVFEKFLRQELAKRTT
jgi:DNA-binding transcriptional LysR family regulator